MHEIGVAQETLKGKTIEVFNKVDVLEECCGIALSLCASKNGLQLLVTSSSTRTAELEMWLNSLERDEAGFRPQRQFISALHGEGINKLQHNLEDLVIQCRKHFYSHTPPMNLQLDRSYQA